MHLRRIDMSSRSRVSSTDDCKIVLQPAKGNACGCLEKHEGRTATVLHSCVDNMPHMSPVIYTLLVMQRFVLVGPNYFSSNPKASQTYPTICLCAASLPAPPVAQIQSSIVCMQQHIPSIPSKRSMTFPHLET